MATFNHSMPFGAEPGPDGVRFRLWAPDADSISLRLEGDDHPKEIPMEADADGWCEAVVADAGPGTRYRFRVNGDLLVPDPASRFQPEDVHGPSEVVDPLAHAWRHADWVGRPWEETVLYELHVGTFTPEGTFRGVIDKLDHLVDLGVTAVELMPVSDFPGKRGWGYDGVYPFAPEAAYGTPHDLKVLIDAAHGRGLMVFLDVVYNHFGPEGNYIHTYAQRFFNTERQTPWGWSINFDGEDSATVRRYFVHNALYWLQEYRFDGLRFDAVHAIDDRSDVDILTELAETVRVTVAPGRHVHLVLENDANEARYLNRGPDGKPALFVAQWNDDIHHAFHTVLTGEKAGYYRDYADAPARHLGRCLAEGFAYQGEPSPFRDGERRGEGSAHLPATAFVAFVQNHDQIGNRAFGERISALAPTEAVMAAAAVLLVAPSPPLLFMGEEWAAAQPFQFFCHFGPDLQDAVREGRRKEFAAFPQFQDSAARERIPDPNAEATFKNSALVWDDTARSPHKEVLASYRRLLALRHEEIVPRLGGPVGVGARARWSEGRPLSVSWPLNDGGRLDLIVNLSGDRATAPGAWPDGRRIFATDGFPETGSEDPLPPWAVAWFVGEAA